MSLVGWALAVGGAGLAAVQVLWVVWGWQRHCMGGGGGRAGKREGEGEGEGRGGEGGGRREGEREGKRNG